MKIVSEVYLGQAKPGSGSGGGGGEPVDYTKVVSKTKNMPVASASNANMVYLYDGVTNQTYTNGYVYQNQKVGTYTDTVTFTPATLSGTTVTATTGALSSLCAQYIRGNITAITNGTMTFDSMSDLWVFVGKDANNNTIGTFQIYQDDYIDAGFTFTGTPQDGDVVSFTCTITEISSTYAWVRIDVQPQPTPAQIGAVSKKTAVRIISTTDWNIATNTATITVNGVTPDNTVIVSPTPISAQRYAEAGVICSSQENNSLTFICTTIPDVDININVLILN